ncbi:acyl-CoA reductase [Hominifimenecus sp. rT4P-3]|uniref:acyl-CoA reductase n=1 Tax=Hominifimenecus sp. rT4P-3 TaxID=3242979 RepID=UPI003DA1FD90
MRIDSVRYLAGRELEDPRPLTPYNDIVCRFLEEFSRRLRKDREAAAYPDLMTLAFFCRKANIQKLKEDFLDTKTRLGRGMIFHIAPSNVPVNFMFSYIFGLLSGNANVVRVSSKSFTQVDIICRVLNQMFMEAEFQDILHRTAIVEYERNREINDYYSARCDGRVIWGGDQTIAELRQSPIRPRCVEIVFADRFSFGVIDSRSIVDASEEEINHLAEQFYNDTYLMDQNACSTPHLIFWKQSGKMKEAKKRFWDHVFQIAQKYDLADIKVSDKYVMLSEYAMERQDICGVQSYGNLLYVVDLACVPKDITSLRGKFGLFFECKIDRLQDAMEHMNETVQTCAYYGIEQEEIVKAVLENSPKGIDRIVPFGSTLDIGVIWDGYDIVGQLSRIIGG